MLEHLQQLISQALRSHEDELLQLRIRLEQLERQQRQQLQPARVLEVCADGQHIRLQAGELQTPPLRWFASAGALSEYRCPSPGEQCLLLSFGDSDNDSRQRWALCGIASEQWPLPGDQPHIHRLRWPDGALLEHDSHSGHHRLQINGDLRLEIGGRLITHASDYVQTRR